MNILTENEIDIKSLEKKFYDYACKLAAEAFKNWLQELDEELMNSRDKDVFRHKGYRKTCIKTLMGEVEYSRAVYQVMDNECEKKFVYLLDEYVGFENIGFISANLALQIADNICETSYGQTAKNISSLTGQTISHQGVWNVVQKLGSQIEAKENRFRYTITVTDMRAGTKDVSGYSMYAKNPTGKYATKFSEDFREQIRHWMDGICNSTVNSGADEDW